MPRSSTLLVLSFLASLCLQANTQLCARSQDCPDCISRAGCVWCSQGDFIGTRCFDVTAANSSLCSEIQDPLSTEGDTTLPPSPDTNPISIKNIDLNLRVGKPVTFNVNVTALRNLPLDLYILMDLSSSMSEVLDAVRDVSQQIAASVSDITTNVLIGFGSFNDKVTSPFTTRTAFNTNIDDPYAFVHRLNFTDDNELFERILTELKITTNIDSAENGLEALAQVLLCEQELNWRSMDTSTVTRLILYLSNDGFHYSGEGKFAGILNPFQGNCLLQRQGNEEQLEFTRWFEVDYPSVGQIVDIVKKQDVAVIFSVAPVVLPTYQELINIPDFRASVASLTIDGGEAAQTEILSTIEDEYRQILREIRLVSDDTSGQFSVSLTPLCPVGATLLPGGDGCDSVPLDSSVMFSVSVTLNNCNGLGNGQTKTLLLDSPAFGSFTVTVNGLCNCACEEDQVINSPACSGNGTAVCGVCNCSENFCGRYCNLTLTGDSVADDCPVGGVAFGNRICSGRGTCNCVCECDSETYGDACECDTSSTQCKVNPDDSEVCSGRGTCCNRACTCRDSPNGNPYRGDSTRNLCQCEPIEEVCSVDGVVCSNRGECLCDSCACPTDFGGNFCEIPLTELCRSEIDTNCISSCRSQGQTSMDICSIPECNQNRPLLFIDQETIMTDTTSNLESHVNTVLMHTMPDAVFMFVEECSVTLPNGCENDYYLLRNSSHIAVVVVREEDCPLIGDALAIPIWALALIILGLLVVLGIAIIVIIKIIFIILDYTEVKRWQKEAREADFSKNQNPLYQSPEMKYENVAYGKE